MAKILRKLPQLRFHKRTVCLVEEMVASIEEIDSLQTIQTNCV